MAKISIIVRTKNEERWISHCLKMIYLQDFSDFEVILVDNASTDATVDEAKKFKLAKIINITNFIPGQALNMGIKASKGEFIVCISAHCIPKNKNWLTNLLSNFKDNKVAGVYGRQLPVSFTDDIDKRDLLTVFGEDKRVQIKDYFFHNANSMLRRDLWHKFPFDENVSNIEDRVWGKKIISAGYKLIYEPEAAVYHYHGLNHGNTASRAKGVVSIIEQIDFDALNELPESMRPENLNIVGIILIKGELNTSSKEYKLLVKTINMLKKSKYLKNTYIVSSKNISGKFGLNWIDRNIFPESNNLGVDELLSLSLKEVEKNKNYPEAIMYINHDYINRPDGFIDEIIYEAQYKGYDSVFPGLIDYGHYWSQSTEKGFVQIASSMKSKSDRSPIYKALYGLGCFVTKNVLKKGLMVGGKVGIFPVHDLSLTSRLNDSEKS